ncbi:TolC family protein [bacterium]|nr:TolC family protein [bacterium]
MSIASRWRGTALAALVMLAILAGGATAEDLGGPPVAADAIPDPLSLGQALDFFRQHGIELLLADAAVAGARGDLRAASAFPNPAVAASGGHSFNYDPSQCNGGCSATAVSVNVSDQGLVIDLLVGKRRLRTDVAAAAVAAATLSRADAERTLLPAVKQQYLRAALGAAALERARDLARTAGETFALVRRRFDTGAVSEADLARAEVAQLEAERAVDVAAEELTAAKAGLAALLGIRGAIVDYRLADGIPPFRVPPQVRDASAESLRELALAHRPDLAAARTRVGGAEAALDLARRERFPDIALTAQYQQEGTGQEAIQPPTATFGVSLPLPLLYQNQGEIGAAAAALQARTLEARKLELQVGSDVASALASVDSARRRVERDQSRLLEQAGRARDLVHYRYEKGAVSLFELLDAERTLAATRTAYDGDLGDYWTAIYTLEQVVGVELE